MSRVVLLVDDDSLVLDVAASMLEDIGCEVVTAAGGAEALEKLSIDERIEILITDVNMPGIDGYALAKYATQTRESLKVIILSGRESESRLSTYPQAVHARRSEENNGTANRPLLRRVAG